MFLYYLQCAPIINITVIFNFANPMLGLCYFNSAFTRNTPIPYSFLTHANSRRNSIFSNTLTQITLHNTIMLYVNTYTIVLLSITIVQTYDHALWQNGTTTTNLHFKFSTIIKCYHLFIKTDSILIIIRLGLPHQNPSNNYG